MKSAGSRALYGILLVFAPAIAAKAQSLRVTHRGGIPGWRRVRGRDRIRRPLQ